MPPSHPLQHSEPNRAIVAAVSLLGGLLLILAFNTIGPIQIPSKAPSAGGERTIALDVSRLLVDWSHYRSANGEMVSHRNPFAIQIPMWLLFTLGLGEIWLRRRSARIEKSMASLRLLPEDDKTLLIPEDMKTIYLQADGLPGKRLLPGMIRRLGMEFRKSKSVERVNALLDSTLELEMHRIDLKYTFLRYITWAIPTLGFIGTVLGIAAALSFAGSPGANPESLLQGTTIRMGVAFYTTMLALMMSGILVLLSSLAQAAEEQVLNDAGRYCLDNLVLRLVEPRHMS